MYRFYQLTIFCNRHVLPTYRNETKMTKIETLRFAYNYIFCLSERLNSERAEIEGKTF